MRPGRPPSAPPARCARAAPESFTPPATRAGATPQDHLNTSNHTGDPELRRFEGEETLSEAAQPASGGTTPPTRLVTLEGPDHSDTVRPSPRTRSWSDAAGAPHHDHPPTEHDRSLQPIPARLHSVFLGGKDHYEPDQVLAENLASSTIRPAIIESHRFTRRAVEYLADHHGVTQFVELGCGLRHAPNIHDIAEQRNSMCALLTLASVPHT
ncbi:SAM-dependent methyltransferase [Nocardia fluminea]|uniref:SAM-dependent methyltransferase n=1 Tax=Nocardia fluminea TaxID=134984 RepID=UPI003645F937